MIVAPAPLFVLEAAGAFREDPDMSVVFVFAQAWLGGNGSFGDSAVMSVACGLAWRHFRGKCGYSASDGRSFGESAVIPVVRCLR